MAYARSIIFWIIKQAWFYVWDYEPNERGMKYMHKYSLDCITE